jgi:hypothetical protein
MRSVSSETHPTLLRPNPSAPLKKCRTSSTAHPLSHSRLSLLLLLLLPPPLLLLPLGVLLLLGLVWLLLLMWGVMWCTVM